MPREFLHWSVLSSARKYLATDRACNFLLEQNYAYAQIGAMLHDAPYYLTREKSALGEKVGAYLHGRDGEDTYATLRSFLSLLEQESSEELRAAGIAMLAGLISHAETDMIFHPMIFYFTGDYYDLDPRLRKLARRRHRLLETYLDCFLLQHSSAQKHASLQTISKNCNKSILHKLLLIFTAAINKDPKCQPLEKTFFIDAFQAMIFYQRLFISPIAAYLAKILVKWNPKLSEFEVLFYRYNQQLDFFSVMPFTFLNPVSGEKNTCSLDDLLKLSATRTKESIAKLINTPQTFSQIQGASLNSGLLKTRCQDFQLFSPTGLNLPGLLIDQ